MKAGRSEKFYMLSAHFDSISQDKDGKILDAAPGADDNASGVAVLLECARVLASREIAQNIGIVFFNLEEVNWGGSKGLAGEWKEKGRRLDGVINIDGIGTWPLSLAQGGKVNYVVNELSMPLMEQIKSAFSLPLKPADTMWEDDHASFWAQGYPAIEFTEEGCSPFMHSPGDTSEKVDFKSVAAVAEAVIELLQKGF
jgi:Zn-dependent M28 family amino/carboxypeptidase